MNTFRLLVLYLCACCFLNPVFSQTVTEFITHDDLSRSYRLHLPPGYSDGASLPLVFNLHGLNSNASEQEFYSQMNAVADTANFIVCYAQGVNAQWNVGWAFNEDTDDVGFINAIIDTLHEHYNIDLNRVYSCGMSNGGFMSYRLACELTDRIAAIASVTGSMAPGIPEQCTPSRQIPVMQIHGTADPIVPYLGSLTNIPIEDLVSFWVNFNGCTGSPVITEVPNTVLTDMCTAERIDYTGCAEDNEVAFYRVLGGVHTWPGAPINIGVTNQDFDASVEIWRFFNRFQLDIESAVGDANQPDLSVIAAPNPFVENLALHLPQGGLRSLKVYNAQGKVVFATTKIMDSIYQIDTHSWANGLYIIHWETGQGKASMKVIKGN
ncbi:MAG: hypothetical protein DHS20C18_05020 [Saprospiraceae bacterium]|nr:MAG: hypothetical protein DHS20C18_05020 [Saprospiraceae bacterium]